MPTIIETDRTNIMAKEETFGPVFTLLKAKNEKDMLDIANDTDFGLGAVVVSRDEHHAEEFGKKIDCGMIFINEPVKSDSRLPSGGVKNSGFGRECSDFGIKEFSNIRTLWV